MDEERAPVRPAFKAVVLTALAVQSSAVVKRLDKVTTERGAHGTRYMVGYVSGHQVDWTVAVAEIGEGNVPAAVEATIAIKDLQPDLILFVGVAGGLKSDVPLGTVVVANRVFLYQSGKAAEDFLARPIGFQTPHALVQLARHVAKTDWSGKKRSPRVEFKPIAAGERVVVSAHQRTF